MAHREYSERRMEKFWTGDGANLAEAFLTAKEMPEVYQRLQENMAAVNQRFGKPLNFNVGGYDKNSRIVIMGSTVIRGVPNVVVVVPNLINMDDALRKSGYEKDVLFVSMVVDIIHELDHLRYNSPPDCFESRKPFSAEEAIARESEAWDYTCRYTISVVVEKYGRVVNPNHADIYRHWLNCRRGENIAEWQAGIRRVYAPAYKAAHLE